MPLATLDHRRHDDLGKPARWADLPPPPINQAGTDIRLARHVRHHGPRGECRGNDCPLLLEAEPPPPLATGKDMNLRNGTASCIGASTVFAPLQDQATSNRRAEDGPRRMVTVILHQMWRHSSTFRWD